MALGRMGGTAKVPSKRTPRPRKDPIRRSSAAAMLAFLGLSFALLVVQ